MFSFLPPCAAGTVRRLSHRHFVDMCTTTHPKLGGVAGKGAPPSACRREAPSSDGSPQSWRCREARSRVAALQASQPLHITAAVAKAAKELMELEDCVPWDRCLSSWPLRRNRYHRALEGVASMTDTTAVAEYIGEQPYSIVASELHRCAVQMLTTGHYAHIVHAPYPAPLAPGPKWPRATVPAHVCLCRSGADAQLWLYSRARPQVRL